MNRKILVVEDDDALRGIIAMFMEVKKPTWSLESAENGREALEKLETFQPDMILCDRMMPEMDGLEFLGRLRSNPRFRNTKFIFLSAMNEPDDLRRAKEAGADDYMVKPIWHADLVKIIDKHLA